MESLRTTLIIGVGNRFRGDDGIGPAVADRLREELSSDCEITESSGDAGELMDLWEGRDLVVIVDAVKSNAPSGTIHTIDVAGDHLPQDVFPASTHTFGLAQAVELARALNRLPERMIICGVEGSDFTVGRAMSESVTGAVDQVVDQVRRLLHSQTVEMRDDA